MIPFSSPFRVIPPSRLDCACCILERLSLSSAGDVTKAGHRDAGTCRCGIGALMCLGADRGFVLRGFEVLGLPLDVQGRTGSLPRALLPGSSPLRGSSPFAHDSAKRFQSQSCPRFVPAAAGRSGVWGLARVALVDLALMSKTVTVPSLFC